MIIRCPRCGATAAAVSEIKDRGGDGLVPTTTVVTGRTVSMCCIDRQSTVCRELQKQARALVPKASRALEEEPALLPDMLPALR
ncbi:MAG: hypothetical protein HKP27_06635 [Myxococcales bacterium]|nr:hypothetical protein [Myxococcales bacterium]